MRSLVEVQCRGGPGLSTFVDGLVVTGDLPNCRPTDGIRLQILSIGGVTAKDAVEGGRS